LLLEVLEVTTEDDNEVGLDGRENHRVRTSALFVLLLRVDLDEDFLDGTGAPTKPYADCRVLKAAA
jgi:hypothetical protein